MDIAIYNDYSNTIRKQPENYCLISFNRNEKGEVKFDVDGATLPYREYVKNAYIEWENEKTNDKNLLAKKISNSIKLNYNPFANYPIYTHSDVSNALRMINSQNSELGRSYYDCVNDLWEADRIDDKNLIKKLVKMKDEIVSGIFLIYQFSAK